LIEEPGDANAAFEAAIERELGDVARRDLRGPAAGLSDRYRAAAGEEDRRGLGSQQVRAYLATRAPATFAATRRVLGELRSLRPDWAPASLLDLGAGPGTAAWAAATVFPALERAVLVEREPEMAALGARLAAGAPDALLAEAAWVVEDVADLPVAGGRAPASDLVLAAYVLGELGAARERSALERWWAMTLGELVVIEPGTPAGFERLRAARRALVEWGAHVTAPCPHDERCPMTAPDWCHFAVRLSRSALHRDVKGARLGYEDEKYAYLAVSASRRPAAVSRLVRSPRPHKGHVRVWLCEADGLNERVISRRDGERYKRARAARWGDRLEPG